jgi:hypothetical protein
MTACLCVFFSGCSRYISLSLPEWQEESEEEIAEQKAASPQTEIEKLSGAKVSELPLLVSSANSLRAPIMCRRSS